MSKLRVVAVAVVVYAACAAFASGASALTLGTTTMPASSSAVMCTAPSPTFLVNSASPGYEYAAPTDGAITSWSVGTSGATPASAVSFVVLRPSGGGYVVIGSDDEVIPSPLPAGGVATYTLTAPIFVDAGDRIGVVVWTTSDYPCYWHNGSLTASTVADDGTVSSTAPGTVYASAAPQPGLLVDLSAELVQSQDVGLAAGAPPATIAGGASTFTFAIGNNGPGTAPVAFTDTVPPGLSLLGAAAGSGDCTVAAPTVQCTIDAVAPGDSAPVLILVGAPTAGSYTDTGSISSPLLSDPNPADNAAAATLTVSPLPAAPAPVLPTCTIVSLKKQTLAVAKLFLPALGCKVGKVTHKTSKTIKKNLIISTSPGTSASQPLNTKVNIVISSGKPKKKTAKAKKKAKH